MQHRSSRPSAPRRRRPRPKRRRRPLRQRSRARRRLRSPRKSRSSRTTARLWKRPAMPSVWMTSSSAATITEKSNSKRAVLAGSTEGPVSDRPFIFSSAAARRKGDDMNKKPIIAFLYDFDKTLCTTDMQDYTFIPSLGYTPGEFWSIANSFGFENRMDGLLAYMYTMIEECRKKGIRLDRDYLVSCGHAIELFPGVQDWFSRINAFGETLGVEIEHYVLSSGLREIIEGSGVSHEFKEIYACEFFYNEEGLASWPKLDVNFTNKTQFVYRINKGILDVAKDKELNASMPDDSKRIPFTNMIYIGDGLSDVPCMKMMRAYGGQAVAVYQDSNRAGVEDLLAKGRVDFIFPADYRDGTLFDETMKNIVRKIAIADALAEENQQQLRSLGRSEVPQQVGLF